MPGFYNRVVLLGNLVQDSELKFVGEKKTPLADITIAVNEKFNGTERTTFVNVELWGKTAEFVNEYLVKGDSVLVEGRLKQDTWETDGQKRSRLLVVCDKLQAITFKKKDAQDQDKQDSGPEEDETPF
jgi:single-strand DNA-binding protein